MDVITEIYERDLRRFEFKSLNNFRNFGINLKIYNDRN